MTGQSRLHSFIEAWANVAIGFGINFVANLLVLPLFGFNVGAAGGLAHGVGARLEGHGRHGDHGHEPGRLGEDSAGSASQGGAAHGLGDASSGGCGIAMEPREGRHAHGADEPRGASATDGHWRAADWLYCRDGRWRPVEPGTFPLAHGAPARVGRLRLYGNAIVAQVAEEFIRAYEEVTA